MTYSTFWSVEDIYLPEQSVNIVWSGKTAIVRYKRPQLFIV